MKKPAPTFFSRDQLIELLQRQNEELITLNRSKDEFVALASHQLRTPATAVRQYLSLLLDGYAEPLTKNQKAFLEQAYESNERQLRLVEEILRVVKVDLDKLPLHKRSVDISVLLRRAAASLKSITDDKAHKIILNLQPVKARVDGRQMELVFENLLENASNYTPQNGKIAISVKSKNGQAEIVFKDNGVGIDAADYPALFQKFSRISNKLSESVNGTGLGLYFCKKIIELHGGRINVEPNSKKGTSFIISLPV